MMPKLRHSLAGGGLPQLLWHLWGAGALARCGCFAVDMVVDMWGMKLAVMLLAPLL
jgi:hypothetical protein